ncbi:hypothetical protein ACFV5N_00205 [Streptomyces sp. NPDC059853]|uniref:hypothetical protein n=1 Tax=Streptomyces sp. NPDC059853 TaxID=3346973 RepID=UPI003665C731
MNALLTELGKSLATRWLSQLMPAGLLFLGTAATGAVLGHTHWYDLPAAVHRLDHELSRPGESSVGLILGATAVVVLVATATGLLIRAMAQPVERLWGGAWPRPLDRLAARRRKHRTIRWNTADESLRAAWRHHATAQHHARPPGVAAPDDAEPARRLAARDRIALERPAHPTWIGDRLHAVDRRVLTTYGLDLSAVWPRLWLLVPEETRSELRTARAAYDAAAQLVAWSVLYLLLALWWWPALPAAAAAFLTGCRRGRAAMDTFCGLAESVVDLHSRELAATLGLPADGPLTAHRGAEITRLLRKDA